MISIDSEMMRPRVVYVSMMLVFVRIQSVSSCTDEAGVIKNGMTCSELMTPDDATECYNNYLKTKCCATCEKFETGKPDCKYGEDSACRREWCEVSLQMCCETCNIRLNETCETDYFAKECGKIAHASCTVGTQCKCEHGFYGATGTKTCEKEATVRCSKTDTEMIMTINAEINSIHQHIVTLKDTTDLITSQCNASVVTTNGKYMELKITVNILNLEQTRPNKTSSDCFVTKDDSVNTRVSVLVVGQANVNVIQGTDRFYKAVCDVDTANGQEISLSNIGISSAITPKKKESETEEVTMELVKAADSSVVTSAVDLTEEVRLKVTLTRKTLATAPLGVFLHDLYVSDRADVTETDNKFRVLNEHGCVEDIPAFKPDSTFVPVYKYIVAETADKFVTITGRFNMALFIGMTNLELFFSVKYEASCYDNTDDKCFNLAKYCADNTPVSRRRRSTAGVKNGTVTLGVRVDLNGYRAANQGSDFNSLEEYKTSRDIWIIAVVLGCLVLVALLCAVFLFYRLKRGQRQSDKMEKFGARNPAF